MTTNQFKSDEVFREKIDHYSFYRVQLKKEKHYEKKELKTFVWPLIQI